MSNGRESFEYMEGNIVDSLNWIVKEIKKYFYIFPERLPLHKEIKEKNSAISDEFLWEKLKNFEIDSIEDLSEEDIACILKAFNLYVYTSNINESFKNNKNYSLETYELVVSHINDLKIKLRSLQREKDIGKNLEQ